MGGDVAAPNTAQLIGEVVLPGLIIVFLGLVILIAAVSLAGVIMVSSQKKKSSGSQSGGETSSGPQDTAPVAAAQAEPENLQATQAGTIAAENETIAAISAAVASVMNEIAPGLPYTINSVKRHRDLRPVWGFAGMQRNTRSL